MSAEMRRIVDEYPALSPTDTFLIQEPDDFSVATSLLLQGYRPAVVDVDAIRDIQRKLNAELTRVQRVEDDITLQAACEINKLLELEPSLSTRTTAFLQRHHSRFANIRNFARQQALQAAIVAIGRTLNNRPSPRSVRTIEQFAAQHGHAPTTDQLTMLACFANLTFNQVQYW
jgi:hypothetical protein